MMPAVQLSGAQIGDLPPTTSATASNSSRGGDRASASSRGGDRAEPKDAQDHGVSEEKQQHAPLAKWGPPPPEVRRPPQKVRRRDKPRASERLTHQRPSFEKHPIL